jgi:hypothetical protein
MAGVSMDHQSKETPAMKSSGEMGSSPKFPIFLMAKVKQPSSALCGQKSSNQSLLNLRAPIPHYDISKAQKRREQPRTIRRFIKQDI